MLKHPIGLVAGLCLSSGAAAQVRGVCVSGCYIPNPQQQQQQTQLDPSLLVGFAAQTTGEVTIGYPDGRSIAASSAAGNRTPIMLGAKIVTGPSGHLQILLVDETVFTVGPNSDMVIDEFVYDPAGGIKKVSARIVEGTFRFVTGKVARKDPEAMKVKLAVGTIGIRGTDLEGLADPAGSGEVILHEGEAVLEEYDTGKIYALHPGQTLRFENFKIVGVQ